MKIELEVLYARQIDLSSNKGESQSPVVRYSDACAAIERLESEVEQKEQLRTNAVRRCEVLLTELESLSATCERLQAELAVFRYGQSAVNDMVQAIGRWDEKPKAL